MNNILLAVVIIGGIGLFFGIILAIAGIVFEVKKDERITDICDVLPGANCGACGYTGCMAYASAIVTDNAPSNCCSVGKDPVAQKIADIMGVDAKAVEPKYAVVLCDGDCNKAKDKYEYAGVMDCVLASKLAGGAKECENGCLGLGTCVSVCKFDAISIVDGIAVVDPDKCTACGQCVIHCPKHIIEIIPAKNNYFVKCINNDKGAFTNKYCQTGCIGCKICEKACPIDAIHVNDNIAKIDYSICKNCGVCADKCPKKIIHTLM